MDAHKLGAVYLHLRMGKTNTAAGQIVVLRVKVSTCDGEGHYSGEMNYGSFEPAITFCLLAGSPYHAFRIGHSY